MYERLRARQSAPRDVAYAIYERDNYTCQECGRRGDPGIRPGDIQVHHIIPFADGGSHDPSNLVTLCVECHRPRDRAVRSMAQRRSVASLSRLRFPPSYGAIAERLGVSPGTVGNWYRRGLLPRFGNHTELETYAASDHRLYPNPGRHAKPTI